MSGLLLALALTISPPAHADALDDCEAAVDLSDPQAQRQTYRCYYQAARQGADWARARALLSARVDHDPDGAWAQLMLAHMASGDGQTDAQSLYREVTARFDRLDLPTGATLARLGLATELMWNDQIDEMFTRLDEADVLAADPRVEDPWLPLMVRVQRARSLQSLGAPHRALAILQVVQRDITDEAPYQMRLVTLHVLTAAAIQIDQSEDAWRYGSQEVALTRDEGDRYVEATALVNLGMLILEDPVLLERHGLDRVRAIAQQALDAADAGHNPYGHAAALYLQGISERREGQANLQASLVELQALEAMDSRPEIAGDLAMITALSDPELAIRQVNEAQRYVDTLEPDDVRRAYVGWMRAWLIAQAHGLRDSAAVYREVLDVVEAWRDRQDDTDARAWVQSVWAVPYYDFAGRLITENNDAEQAFGVMERLRANNLLVAMARAQAPMGPDTRAARRAYQATLNHLSALQRRIMDGEQGLANDLKQAEAQAALAQEAQALVDSTTPGLAPTTPPDLEAIRQALAPDEAMVVFQLGHTDPLIRWLHPEWRTPAWALLIHPEGTHPQGTQTVALSHSGLADADRLALAVNAYTDLIQRRDGSERGLGHTLYQDLITPWIDHLSPGIRHLVIVPDGALDRLALAALAPAPDQPMLGERVALSQVSSAAVWLHQRRLPPAPSTRVLALADPVILGADDAPAPQRAATGDWPSLLTHPLGRVPATRREARIAMATGAKGSQALLGTQASEQAIKTANWDQLGLLHVAAHAVVQTLEPDRTALVLAPGAPDQDGLLQVREIARMRLSGQLVVLSACATASGTELPGAGVMGLVRAFMQAGARTVIATLWPTRDHEAALFFERFYKHLSAGSSVDEAVTATRHELHQAGVPTEDWAGVVVFGDGAIRPAARDHRPLTGWRGGLLVVLLLLGATLSSRVLRRHRAARTR